MAYDPLNSPAYVAGTLTVPAGVPTNLLALIQASLEPNYNGAALGVTIQADAANSDNVYVGAASHSGGALSATNYGYVLSASGSAYRSSAGAGFSAPVGQIQVFAVAQQTIHVECY